MARAKAEAGEKKGGKKNRKRYKNDGKIDVCRNRMLRVALGKTLAAGQLFDFMLLFFFFFFFGLVVKE